MARTTMVASNSCVVGGRERAEGVVLLFELERILTYQRKKRSVQGNERCATRHIDEIRQTGPKKTQPR